LHFPSSPENFTKAKDAIVAGWDKIVGGQ
jgi:hypothetical protein